MHGCDFMPLKLNNLYKYIMSNSKNNNIVHHAPQDCMCDIASSIPMRDTTSQASYDVIRNELAAKQTTPLHCTASYQALITHTYLCSGDLKHMVK